MQGTHDGHRERIRQKFLASGFSSFADHEILEMLLFYSIPRKNTNELAHRLIQEFGSIENVFSASIELLMEVKGMSKSSAVLIKMIPDLCKIYLDGERKIYSDSVTSFDDIKTLAIKQYVGESTEILKAIYLDSNCKYLQCVDISTINDNCTTNVNTKRIIEQAEKYNSSHLIIMHNHPNGNIKPSNFDIWSTQNLEEVLKMTSITLVDHLIVADDKVISMRDFEYI
jgi:DNA repair protein RadC